MLDSFLPQLRYRSAAPSSEGILGGYHSYTHVLVNDPTRGMGYSLRICWIRPYKWIDRSEMPLSFFYNMCYNSIIRRNVNIGKLYFTEYTIRNRRYD